MRSPIEVEYRQKAGSAIADMPPELVTTTLCLIRALYVPTTLTPIWDPANTKHLTLLISFDYLPELINEFLTLSLMAKLLPTREITDGGRTAD